MNSEKVFQTWTPLIQTNGSLQDVIGRALEMIGAYNDLDNKQQVVALIDDVSGSVFKEHFPRKQEPALG